jgi:hypothetical protein
MARAGGGVGPLQPLDPTGGTAPPPRPPGSADRRAPASGPVRWWPAHLLVAVAAFQVALTAGAPWGEVTQGGRASTVDGVLTAGPRVLAALSACVLLLSAWVVLARAGLVPTGLLGDRFVRAAAWAVVALLAVNTLGNLAGRHPLERWGTGSVSLGAMVLAAVVAHSRGRGDRSPAR